jgi:predicted DNA-binding transcriptional regulator AlpA
MTTATLTALVLRKRSVCALLGISLAHLDRQRKSGDFPAAIRLGEQAIGWTRDSIDAWLAARPTVTH